MKKQDLIFSFSLPLQFWSIARFWWLNGRTAKLLKMIHPETAARLFRLQYGIRFRVTDELMVA